MTVNTSGWGSFPDPDDLSDPGDVAGLGDLSGDVEPTGPAEGLDPMEEADSAGAATERDPLAPPAGPSDPDTQVEGVAEPVEIVWRGSEPEWVSPHSEWATLTTGPGLLRRVVELVNAGSGRTADDWAFRIDLAKIPLHNLGEFNALFAEAVAESRSAPNQLEVRSTRHLRAVWKAQRLLEITGDLQWLAKASRQAIAEELSAAARMPEATDTTRTARNRLLDFIGADHG